MAWIALVRDVDLSGREPIIVWLPLRGEPEPSTFTTRQQAVRAITMARAVGELALGDEVGVAEVAGAAVGKDWRNRARMVERVEESLS